MKKVVKLTESDLMRIVNRIINEEEGFVASGDVDKFIKTTTDNKGTWHIDRNTNTLYLSTPGRSYQLFCKK
jgi:hypothetical protein